MALLYNYQTSKSHVYVNEAKLPFNKISLLTASKLEKIINLQAIGQAKQNSNCSSI